MENQHKSSCELVNTYEALEHIMGINGLHPHSLSTIEQLHNKIINHSKNKKGIIVDIGCGSAHGTYRLSQLLPEEVSIIGIDINRTAIDKARTVIDQWLRKYNEYRPHGSLKGKTPKLFLEQWRQEQSIDKAA